MATGANATVFFRPESEAAATPKWRPIGFKSTSLVRAQEPIQSERMRGDRMNHPSVNGGVTVSGSISTELVFGEQDDLIAGVLGGSWVGDEVIVGKENQTFEILEQMDGVAGKKWRLYRGCVVNTLSLDQQPNAITQAEYGFVGIAGDLLDEAPAGSTFLTPSENSSMTAPLGEIMLDGKALGIVTAATLSIDNGAESRPVVGSLESLPIIQRNCSVTSSVTIYYEDSALAEKAQTGDRISLQFTYSDDVGNKLIAIATRVKPANVWPAIDGAADITASVELTFEPDNAKKTSITFKRVKKAVSK